ncbi:family 43 glycosylhydrolase [Archangium gephyra]|uniref:family 43 glycosylhydrolase n=1 Tax=Archangium gephyra TaxID=48 RepID=UPI0035D3D8BB
MSFKATLFSLTTVAVLVAAGCSTSRAKPQPLQGSKPQPLQVSNPVMPGDYADPSVIRVGDDYWATATSSEWAPHFPLLHSKDLVNWEQAGVVFESAPEWAEANYWAPELLEDKGQFFVYYTARKKGGPLCVSVATAAQPQGPYTDHGPLVCDPDGSIDGVLIRDENDVPYLVWKQDGNSRGQPTPIWAQRLTEDRTRFAEGSTRQQLIVNDAPWEGSVVEGPYLLKRDGWFYMFYAGGGCCGRTCSYGEGVARSRKLLSGWEKHPSNPIVGANAEWKCPGHGSVVTDASGQSYLLYHAYSARDTVYVGRQAVLDPLTWGTDGWPSINTHQGTGGGKRAPTGFSDEFNGSTVAMGWQWPQGNRPQASVSGGMLTLAPNANRATEPAGAVLARSTNTGQYVAVTALDPGGFASGTQAGLSAFGDPENSVGIRLKGSTLEVWSRQGNKEQTLGSAPAPGGARVYLRMTAREGHFFRFSASNDGSHWLDVGNELNGDFLPPWDRGVRVALTAGGVVGASARFDSLTITPR